LTLRESAAYNQGMPSLPAPPLTVTFLGCGTSTGVPSIGCHCAVCLSSEPKNKRLRPSIVVRVRGGENAGANLLVDTTPDMRTQVLRAGIERVEAVLLTHAHADHIFGMDDIRQYNFRHGMRMPIYGTPDVLDHVRRVFEYCFMETQEGGGKPMLDLVPITPYVPFTVQGVTVTPITVMHGNLSVTAYKFGPNFAYVTDVSAIPDKTRPYLNGLDTLILGAVRYDPHPTHFGFYQALDEIEGFRPRQAYLTHLAHHFDYETAMGQCPAGVALGYDGLTFDVPGSGAARVRE
jgi:phosphoribosyl 1,2-cyclic phosphate phosphodiesterase